MTYAWVGVLTIVCFPIVIQLLAVTQEVDLLGRLKQDTPSIATFHASQK